MRNDYRSPLSRNPASRSPGARPRSPADSIAWSVARSTSRAASVRCRPSASPIARFPLAPRSARSSTQLAGSGCSSHLGASVLEGRVESGSSPRARSVQPRASRGHALSPGRPARSPSGPPWIAQRWCRHRTYGQPTSARSGGQLARVGPGSPGTGSNVPARTDAARKRTNSTRDRSGCSRSIGCGSSRRGRRRRKMASNPGSVVWRARKYPSVARLRVIRCYAISFGVARAQPRILE